LVLILKIKRIHSGDSTRGGIEASSMYSLALDAAPEEGWRVAAALIEVGVEVGNINGVEKGWRIVRDMAMEGKRLGDGNGIWKAMGKRGEEGWGIVEGAFGGMKGGEIERVMATMKFDIGGEEWEGLRRWGRVKVRHGLERSDSDNPIPIQPFSRFAITLFLS